MANKRCPPDLGLWCRKTGDDLTWEWVPDDVTVPGSTTAVQTWSEPLVQIRSGEDATSTLLASSDGTDPKIILDGYTFDGPGGLVVPPTDFTVPIFTWVILGADSKMLGPSTGWIELWIEAQVKIEGVITTIVPARPLVLISELAIPSV